MGKGPLLGRISVASGVLGIALAVSAIAGPWALGMRPDDSWWPLLFVVCAGWLAFVGFVSGIVAAGDRQPALGGVGIILGVAAGVGAGLMLVVIAMAAGSHA